MHGNQAQDVHEWLIVQAIVPPQLQCSACCPVCSTIVAIIIYTACYPQSFYSCHCYSFTKFFWLPTIFLSLPFVLDTVCLKLQKNVSTNQISSSFFRNKKFKFFFKKTTRQVKGESRLNTTSTWNMDYHRVDPTKTCPLRS